jgi:hypothetical protein
LSGLGLEPLGELKADDAPDSIAVADAVAAET